MSLVSANKVETNTYELVVSIGAEDFKKGIDKIYKKTAKNITVPGFRKGKAPKSVIEKLYGEAVFYEDTVNDMYPDAYTKACLLYTSIPCTGLYPEKRGGRSSYSILQQLQTAVLFQNNRRYRCYHSARGC